MQQSNWIKITALDNLPLREGRSVKLAGLDIAIFNLGDRCVALENRCPHLGGPLVDGIVSSSNGKITVTCPLHARRVCLDRGEVLVPSGSSEDCALTFPVAVVDGVVTICLDTILKKEVA